MHTVLGIYFDSQIDFILPGGGPSMELAVMRQEKLLRKMAGCSEMMAL